MWARVIIGFVVATTMRRSGIRPGRSPGNSSFTRHANDCGPVLETAKTTPEPEDEIPRYAFLGVRGCDLAAIATLDRVLGRPEYPDNSFVARRRQTFVVAVNCTEPGGLCFCASMGTGPAAGPGYDLALTERLEGDAPSYLVDIGSPEGTDVLAAVPHRTAS